MVYVPGAGYRGGSYSKTGSVYASRREVQQHPRVSFTREQLLKSEGLSRQLAQNLLGGFREAGLEIHEDKPIREKVIRSRRPWVPAVLRYSEVPAAVLLEVCNLANSKDRELLKSREFRQKVAEAIVEGLVSYYSGPAVGSEAVQVAAAGR